VQGAVCRMQVAGYPLRRLGAGCREEGKKRVNNQVLQFFSTYSIKEYIFLPRTL
jgi:hypothetical protein